jgi:hypothetical protein
MQDQFKLGISQQLESCIKMPSTNDKLAMWQFQGFKVKLKPIWDKSGN